MPEASTGPSRAITVATSFPTPARISKARNASTFIPCVFLRANFGARTHHPGTPFIWTCGTTTLSTPDLNVHRLPRDEGGPVFAEPWQAQAFALAVRLSAEGHFTWKEWAAALADELKSAADRGEPDDGSRYYHHWLAALERLVTAKGLTDSSSLARTKEAWADAYRH